MRYGGATEATYSMSIRCQSMPGDSRTGCVRHMMRAMRISQLSCYGRLWRCGAVDRMPTWIRHQSWMSRRAA